MAVSVRIWCHGGECSDLVSWRWVFRFGCHGGECSDLGVMAVSVHIWVSWRWVSILVSWRLVSIFVCHGGECSDVGFMAVSVQMWVSWWWVFRFGQLSCDALRYSRKVQMFRRKLLRLCSCYMVMYPECGCNLTFRNMSCHFLKFFWRNTTKLQLASTCLSVCHTHEVYSHA
jgi:hypothetical protein